MSDKDARVPSISRSTSGVAVYQDYEDNFVIWPGREGALEQFVNKRYHDGPRLKLLQTKSSNSEDALTWSCFDTLNNIPGNPRKSALAHLWALAFDGRPAPEGFLTGEITIGKEYNWEKENTEVDASIEGDKVLVFIEAKLYSPISPADPHNRKPYDQIARKLRIGLGEAQRSGKDFYFILLDIAPRKILRGLKPRPNPSNGQQKPRGGFAGKWQTADSFSLYKGMRGNTGPLCEALKGLSGVDVNAVANNMGWLTWSDVFKAVLRATVESLQLGSPRGETREFSAPGMLPKLAKSQTQTVLVQG